MKEDTKVVKGDATDRRALLKGLVAGSAVVTGTKALPENWTKPISDAVILPGHAVTTQGDYTGGDGYAGEGGDYSEDQEGDYYEYSLGDGYGDGDERSDYGSDNGTDFDYGTDAADDSDYYQGREEV